MIRVVTQEGEESLFSTGLSHRFARKPTVTNTEFILPQNIRIVAGQYPTIIAGVIIVEHAEATDRFVGANAFPPKT